MGKQAPRPGDYTGAAQQQAAQSAANVAAQTQQNRANTSGPLGTQTWTTGPDGRPMLQQGFSAGVQPLADRLQGAAADAWATPLDNGSAARDQTINSAFSYAQSRLDPQWQQQAQLQQSALANQGLDPNSAAARAANLQFGQQRNDAYNGAMNNAITQGNQAGSQVFQNNLQARNAALEQLRALAAQASQGPSYNAAGLAETPQTLAALMGQDSANLNQWQATNQANSDVANGIFNAIGSVGSLASSIGTGGLSGLFGGGKK